MIPSINTGASAAPLVRSRYLMGTLCEVTLPREADAPAVEAAYQEIARLESILTTYRPDSEVSRLNAAAGGGPVAVSSAVWEVLAASSDVWTASGGLFDPTYASSPPARGFGRVVLDPAARTARLAAGAHLDFGGIGKGYALDAAARVLGAHGVTAALLNFGGQLFALGTWPVETGAGTLFVDGASVATSGDAERPGHIVDPATGRSVRKTDLATVILPSATLADAWTKPLYLGGLAALPRDFPGCAILSPLGGAPPTVFGHCPRRER